MTFPFLRSLLKIGFCFLIGTAWAGSEQLIERYPEILWLADSQARRTEEGNAAGFSSYSEQLFGQKFIELDRTLMSLHCLRLILDGSDQSYAEFVADQPEDVALERKSFQQLHLQGEMLLKSQWEGMSEREMLQAMETALVLGDMGKSAYARELFLFYGISPPDQDDFYGEAIQKLLSHPEHSPSFARLSSRAKKLLSKVANLAHYGHITHLEGGVSMFSGLKESAIPSSDPVALSFDFFIHTCDIAGALGHINPHSSLTFTEPACLAEQAMENAVRILSDPHKTEKDAYCAYLAIRADWLGFHPEEKLDRVLTRTGAMLRLFTPEEGAILKKAAAQLSATDLNRILSWLDAQEKEFCRTPTYMPALLVNLSNNLQLGASREERLCKAVCLGLPFISKVLEKHEEQLSTNEADPNIPLNFNRMAGIAKTSPDLLHNEFTIDSEGIVSLKDRSS